MQLVKFGDLNWAVNRNRFSKRLDPLDFVHGLCRKPGLATMRAGAHRNAFDHQKRLTTAETARDLTQFGSLETACNADRVKQDRR